VAATRRLRRGLRTSSILPTAPPHKTRAYCLQGRAGRPSRRRAAPQGLPSRGWGRPGGTLGGPAVGDSGHGPDRRALKQANNSSQTRLYTALQSAPSRALRHGRHLSTPDVESTLGQLRRAWFRLAESLQGSLRSPIGIDAAGKSTKHDAAANLVTQACSGHPLGAPSAGYDGIREYRRVATERQRQLCSREGAIVSERNRGLRASERRRVARTIALSARHKRASGIPSRYAKARHLPCTLSWRGAYLPTHVREGCPAGWGLVSWAKSAHLSPKVRRFTTHSWSNGRQPPTATCDNARDQPPSQRHAAWKLHSIVRNREGDDELSRPEGPVEVGFERKPRVKYLSVLQPFLQGTGWSKKKRTPGPIFGSPVAGTPVRRGGALVRRPATAGPPGATLKPIGACFMRRGCM
jgi:hypothetical protein